MVREYSPRNLIFETHDSLSLRLVLFFIVDQADSLLNSLWDSFFFFFLCSDTGHCPSCKSEGKAEGIYVFL